MDEHAKVQVKEIRFLGNAARSPDRRPPASCRRARAGSSRSSTRTGTYREEAFQHDLQAVQAVYLDTGYVNVKVGKPSVALSPDRRFLYITIPVEEGEQYTVGKIAFSGQLLDQEPRLRRVLRTKERRAFSRSNVGQDLFAVGDVYKDMGYAYANVTPLTATDRRRSGSSTSPSTSSPAQGRSFERIEIVGNDKTRDKVIRRELRIYEGELFSGTGHRRRRSSA